ncbi:MAG: hypothetical protein ABSC94_12945 [Polyangiaceae bacterium]
MNTQGDDRHGGHDVGHATMRALMAWMAAVLTLCLAFEARADGPPPRRVLALVVTNNKSAELGRPELRYADDDGAKYYDLFRMVADEADVEILTDFDADSARLFPEALAAARMPIRSEVQAASARLAARARQASGAGERVDFYFVFAGHGDVDHGRGFLELRDGRLTSDDIESILKTIPATREHVILDSCNSFFVLNPRRPGGRQLAVTEEAARSLSDRLPNVGVLLSTSAEAEVFEWSELQSGIFSHEVRSGLFGAADANGDGRVSYAEIRAFVDVASARIDNPLYRPRLFARGPNGNGDEPILDLSEARAARIEVDGREQRLTVRDAQELPWIDLHKEAGATLTLRLPIGRAMGASIDERDALAPGAPIVSRRPARGGGAPGGVTLASMSPRGPSELLAKLFAAPFGPHAFAQWWQGAPAQEEPVYGVSREDATRMRMLLANVADIERRQRQLTAASTMGLGALFLAGGLGALFDPALNVGSSRAAVGYTAAGLGAAGVLYGGLTLASPSDGETLYDSYLAGMGSPGQDAARIVARTEERLFELSDRYRTKRRWVSVLGWSLVGVGVATAVITESGARTESARWVGALEGGLFAVEGGVFVLAAAAPTPVERLADLWANDPASEDSPRHVTLGLSLAPLRGGGCAGVTGTF